MMDTPSGCLGCNTEPVKNFLEEHGIDPNKFTEVPRPRHDWSDINCCNECGRAWLLPTEEEREEMREKMREDDKDV
jgi:hypothetical protein